MSTTAVAIDFPPTHSRLTTFFRLILIIPLVIFGYVYELVTLLAVLITWVAMVITGRYPEGLYNFVSGYVRFYGRYSGYILLAVDVYPPFSGGPAPEYPIQVTIPERQASYSRLKAFFRFIYVIPALLIVAVLGILLYIVEILAWIIILITGRLPESFAKYIQFTLGWAVKFIALYFLLIENY
jgi:Domain of unknown function (DUF4389)